MAGHAAAPDGVMVMRLAFQGWPGVSCSSRRTTVVVQPETGVGAAGVAVLGAVGLGPIVVLDARQHLRQWLKPSL